MRSVPIHWLLIVCFLAIPVPPCGAATVLTLSARQIDGAHAAYAPRELRPSPATGDGQRLGASQHDLPLGRADFRALRSAELATAQPAGP
jgi:hypothetical protein